MKCLDLFSGLGGLSRGFDSVGFEVLGVEINREISRQYPFDVICTDVKSLSGKHFRDFEVIAGSPPCREFSHLKYAFGHRWKKKPDIYRGLENVYAFLRIINEAKPKIWIMENVPGLSKHILVKPRYEKVLLANRKYRNLWGNFPPFLIPVAIGHKKHTDRGKYRRWENAIIPFPFARAIAEACKEELNKDLK